MWYNYVTDSEQGETASSFHVIQEKDKKLQWQDLLGRFLLLFRQSSLERNLDARDIL